MTSGASAGGGRDVLPEDAGGRALFTSAGALVGSRIVVAALGWAGTILIVRTLTPEAWGQFSLVFTVLATLSFITSLGSSRIVLSELARRDDEGAGAYAGSYIVLRTALGTLAYAAAVGFVAVAGYPAEVLRTTALAGVILVVAAAGSGLDVVYQSRFRLGVVAATTVVAQLGQLALTVVVALTRPSLLAFVLPAIAFDVIAAALKGRLVGRVLPLRLRVDVQEWRSILVQAAPLAAGSACMTLALGVDLLVLSKTDTFAAVGQLAVADKFTLVVGFVPIALEPPLLAVLVKLWPDHVDRFSATVRRGNLLMTLAAGLVLVGFLPLAPELIALLYGEEYRGAATAARLSVLAACLHFYTWVVLGALIATGRTRDYLWFNVVALGVTVVASAAFVPALSVLGAGIARLVTAVVVLGLVAVLARRRLPGRSVHLGRNLLVAACAVASGAAGHVLTDLVWWPLAGAVACLAYVGLLHLTRAPGPAGVRSLMTEEPLAEDGG